MISPDKSQNGTYSGAMGWNRTYPFWNKSPGTYPLITLRPWGLIQRATSLSFSPLNESTTVPDEDNYILLCASHLAYATGREAANVETAGQSTASSSFNTAAPAIPGSIHMKVHSQTKQTLHCNQQQIHEIYVAGIDHSINARTHIQF